MSGLVCAKPPVLAMAGLEFFAVLEAHRDNRHEHELCDAVPEKGSLPRFQHETRISPW
jgi:hypothetical protein